MSSPLRANLDFNQAARVTARFLTAWHMLVGLSPHSSGTNRTRFLGASSGVGIAAIQIAKLFHARVITTAGDETKLEKARGLYLEYSIFQYQQKISEEVKKLRKKEGVDIDSEHVGAATWEHGHEMPLVVRILVTFRNVHRDPMPAF